MGLLGDGDPQVRSRAAESLWFAAGIEEVWRALVGLLGDGDPQVRSRAAGSLYDSTLDSVAVQPLKARLSDERTVQFRGDEMEVRDFAWLLLKRYSDAFGERVTRNGGGGAR